MTPSVPKPGWGAQSKSPSTSSSPGSKAGWGANAKAPKVPAGAPKAAAGPQPASTSQTAKPARVATIAEPAYVNSPTSKPQGSGTVNDKPSNFSTQLDGNLGSGSFSGGVGKPFKTGTSGPEASFDASLATKPFKQQAQIGGEVSGRYGTASYQAGGKANVGGSVGANGTLNYDGLNLGAQGKIGADASATLGGKLSTNPMTMGGVPVTGRLEGSATASTSLGAHASGSANFAAYPPTAVIEGKAGASAGAKFGTNFNVGAGPFNMSGNVHATAGLDASASANAGYQNGKLQFGAQAGLSPGLGFGGGFQATVDTLQLGQMTNHFINNPTGRPQPSLWEQAGARQQMQQAHAGYYQNVSSWVDGGSW